MSEKWNLWLVSEMFQNGLGLEKMVKTISGRENSRLQAAPQEKANLCDRRLEEGVKVWLKNQNGKKVCKTMVLCQRINPVRSRT